MTDFEKVQIGFDIGWSVVVGFFLVYYTVALQDIEDWLARDFHAKFGYTKWWGVA